RGLIDPRRGRLRYGTAAPEAVPCFSDPPASGDSGPLFPGMALLCFVFGTVRTGHGRKAPASPCPVARAPCLPSRPVVLRHPDPLDCQAGRPLAGAPAAAEVGRSARCRARFRVTDTVGARWLT